MINGVITDDSSILDILKELQENGLKGSPACNRQRADSCEKHTGSPAFKKGAAEGRKG